MLNTMARLIYQGDLSRALTLQTVYNGTIASLSVFLHCDLFDSHTSFFGIHAFLCSIVQTLHPRSAASTKLAINVAVALQLLPI